MVPPPVKSKSNPGKRKSECHGKEGAPKRQKSSNPQDGYPSQVELNTTFTINRKPNGQRQSLLPRVETMLSTKTVRSSRHTIHELVAQNRNLWSGDATKCTPGAAEETTPEVGQKAPKDSVHCQTSDEVASVACEALERELAQEMKEYATRKRTMREKGQSLEQMIEELGRHQKFLRAQAVADFNCMDVQLPFMQQYKEIRCRINARMAVTELLVKDMEEAQESKYCLTCKCCLHYDHGRGEPCESHPEGEIPGGTKKVPETKRLSLDPGQSESREIEAH